MLLKINHIKNIGRFYEVTPKGTPDASCTLERFNLFYADNGTGKTTLGAIMKSLALNEPGRILSRKTIAGTGPCEASLEIDNQQCNFLNDVWKKSPSSKFAIFDEEFVEKNIFSATGVETDHKRQLFNYVVFGEENVDKAQELKALTEDQIPAATREITALETQLKTASGLADLRDLIALKPLAAEDFAKLQDTISTADTQIRSSERIKTHKALDKLPAVSWPDHGSVLSQGLDEIGNVEAYKAHIQAHHKWLKHGLDIQKDGDQCPYCFRDVKGNEAIQAYKQFFSAQCQAFMTQVADLSTAISTTLSHDKALLTEKTVSGNNETCAFWQAMDSSIATAVPFAENYTVRMAEYRDAVLRLVDQKQSNILLPVQITDADKIVLNIASELNVAIGEYNKAVDTINAKIASIKAQHLTLNELKQQHANNMAILKAQQAAFHNDITKQSLVRYRALLKDKQAKTDRLNELRLEISAASVHLLDNYQTTINRLLKSFGVEYRINKVERKSDTARKEQLTFAIELKGMTFDPNGDRKIPYSLTNTLSSGDKSTLAFALFLAKLLHSDLTNTVVVFDDPISSLDFFRKQQTSKQITALSANAKQTIVLTHSMEFSRLFGHPPVTAKFFKLFKADSLAGVVVTPYNKLSDMCVSKHNDEHEAITTYLAAPQTVKRLDVMKAIRSYVETKLCTYMPELAALNPPNLGTFIKHLRQKNTDAAYIADLEMINDSIVIENHGGSATADDHSNLTDEELRNLCRLALDLSAPSDDVPVPLPAKAEPRIRRV